MPDRYLEDTQPSLCNKSIAGRERRVAWRKATDDDVADNKQSTR